MKYFIMGAILSKNVQSFKEPIKKFMIKSMNVFVFEIKDSYLIVVIKNKQIVE